MFETWHHNAKSGSEWSVDHHARVRASKGKYLSIGPDRRECTSVQIWARWFHATFPGNICRENPDG
jgi:hypothetical protein